MLNKFPVACLLTLLLLVSGCATTFTNLTPQHQERNANNLYPVEVALDSRQQTLRWDSIHPQIVVGTEFYSMRPTKMMAGYLTVFYVGIVFFLISIAAGVIQWSNVQAAAFAWLGR